MDFPDEEQSLLLALDKLVLFINVRGDGDSAEIRVPNRTQGFHEKWDDALVDCKGDRQTRVLNTYVSLSELLVLEL